MLRFQEKIDEVDTFANTDYEKQDKHYKEILASMVKTVEEYHKWIGIESRKDEKEMTIYQVGKLNPKHVLAKNTEEVTHGTIGDLINM